MALASAALSAPFGLDGVAVPGDAVELVHMTPPGPLLACVLLAAVVTVFVLLIAFVLRVADSSPRGQS